MAPVEPQTHDLEAGHPSPSTAPLAKHLTNTSISTFSWSGIDVTVPAPKSHKSSQPLTILSLSSGYASAGEVLALMGPSGSGKTTLLNVLAHRTAARKADVNGKVMVDGRVVSRAEMGQLSSYVEQEDALIGSLNVRETVSFAAKLSLRGVSVKERKARVEALIGAFGLQKQADTIVGTPLQKGLSGGQKRRLGVASQLVTSPKILCLDEPTSGLDSAASREVMGYIRGVARGSGIIVVASIHQPSTATFELFDRVLLLSGGKTCFFGRREELKSYWEGIGLGIPKGTNPAEYLLDLVNVDFSSEEDGMRERVERVHEAWGKSEQNRLVGEFLGRQEEGEKDIGVLTGKRHSTHGVGVVRATAILLHRNFIKSHRDLLAYATRLVMYMGLAFMMGTVWLRLPYNQSSIQPFINAIFFGGKFQQLLTDTLSGKL
jgi:ABC-type multidrug transport system ATPase subunit